jgi:hypothetical protein
MKVMPRLWNISGAGVRVEMPKTDRQPKATLGRSQWLALPTSYGWVFNIASLVCKTIKEEK